MIRFIDLKRQIDTSLDDTTFAFYDTIVDRFLTFDKEQAFADLQDFLDCFKMEYKKKQVSEVKTEQDKERLVRLIPKDYFNG